MEFCSFNPSERPPRILSTPATARVPFKALLVAILGLLLFCSTFPGLLHAQARTPYSPAYSSTPNPQRQRNYNQQQAAPPSPINLLPAYHSPEESLKQVIELTVIPGDTNVDLAWQYLEKESQKEETPPLPLFGEKRFQGAGESMARGIPEEGTAGFFLFYGEASGNYSSKVDVGKVFKYRVRGLENYKKYFFAVKAYTKQREFTDPSNEVSATPKPVEELLSDIEKLLSGDIPATISTKLKQFGYEIFRKAVPTFAPVTDVPVGPNYVIGPGDSFTVTLWGKAEAVFPVKVSRAGEIILPKVGAIKVWGLTLAQLRKAVQAGLRRYYPDFQMNITMNKLRVIRVFIVGETATPGSYSLSSLSTMINALFVCGGPTKNGSLRQVQLIRNGKVVDRLDVYAFLLKGDKSQDARLEAGDTIFIPVIGKVAGIAGNVKRPAIYEMKGAMTIGQLIKLAGGVTPTGSLQRVQIERVLAHEKKIVVDLDLSPTIQQGDFFRWNTPIQDGDMVKIYPIIPSAKNSLLPLSKNIVYLEGHVMRPAGYELKPGMKLSDLIPAFEVLLPEPHLEYAEIIRLEEPDFHKRVIPFNLGKVLQKDPQYDLKLQRFDRVRVYSKLDFKDKYTVSVVGEVRRPGGFLLFENMRIKDLIEKAGGFEDNAYLQQAELTRQLISPEGLITERVEVDLERAMLADEAHNLLLQKADTLKVRIIPEWRGIETITIKGKVRFPGQYTIKKGETLSSAIRRAGGYTSEAYLRGAVFTRESIKEKQRQRLEELVERQEQEIQTTSALMMELGALGKQDIGATKQSLALQQELLKKLKAAKITGRVVVKLIPLDEFSGSEYDLKLEADDELFIPVRPSTVDVLGEVYNPTALLYRKNRTVSHYLEKVGGPTENAEDEEIYLVLADGSVISRLQKSGWGISWDSENKRWVSGGFMNTKLEPGDSILVPRKLARLQWLQATSMLTQILYQVAIAAGVTVALFL